MARFDFRRLQDAFAGPLEEFVEQTGARLAVLINRSGQVLAQHGFNTVFDLVGVASLAAGINASSRALATHLGEERFDHLHHAGDQRRLFLGQFDTPAGQFILVTVFDRRSSVGLVRLYFEELFKGVEHLSDAAGSPSAANPADFERELEASLDRFFNDLVGG